MKQNNDTYFSEHQDFYKKLLMALVFTQPLVFIACIIFFHTDPIQTTIYNLILTCLLIVGLKTGLSTYIDESGIKFKWVPFRKSFVQYPWSAIKKVEIIQYKFVGYGYRSSLKYGIVHNIKGNKGLQVWLQDGRKILIGTQKPEELKYFLEKNKKINQ